MASARFVASATSPGDLPAHDLVEIAFAGRSNVGKSSLLGAVLGNPRLVRTSRTPGRTQALNLFVLGSELALVDLPGYGYASVSKQRRGELERMLRSYLSQRPALAGIVLLVDARREEVSELDRAFASWVVAAGNRLLPVVTKADLVARPRRGHVTKVIEEGLGVPRGSALLCSASTGEGVKQLVSALFQLRAEVAGPGRS